MKTILIQLDTDSQPSSFDRVVAVDAGVDELFSYGGVTPENVEPLVHGAIFTRGPADLKNTALFIGGSNVAAGEAVLEKVLKTFFGPMRVSVMMDSNGSNTTAAAAVLAASKHLDLAATEALVLGGTGPVGLRAAQILASQGAEVHVASRSLQRAEQACATIARNVEGAKLTACTSEGGGLQEALGRVQLVIAAGAAGVQFLDADGWQAGRLAEGCHRPQCRPSGRARRDRSHRQGRRACRRDLLRGDWCRGDQDEGAPGGDREAV